MARTPRRYVRQMPKVYGNLHKPKRSWAWLKTWFKWTAITAAACAALYGFFLGPFFRVQKVEVDGAVLSDPTSIAASVPLGSSIWFLPKQHILQLVDANPLITNVDILRGIPSSVKLVVTERQPELRWVTGGTTYLVDSNGIPFMSYANGAIPDPSSPAGAKVATLLQVNDTKNLPVTIGKPFLGTTFMAFSQDVQTQLAKYLPILHIDHAEVSDTTYDLNVVTKEGMQIQFNTQADAGVQVRNLTRLIQQEKVNITTAHVDLRINRWAYVY